MNNNDFKMSNTNETVSGIVKNWMRLGLGYTLRHQWGADENAWHYEVYHVLAKDGKVTDLDLSNPPHQSLAACWRNAWRWREPLREALYKSEAIQKSAELELSKVHQALSGCYSAAEVKSIIGMSAFTIMSPLLKRSSMRSAIRECLLENSSLLLPIMKAFQENIQKILEKSAKSPVEDHFLQGLLKEEESGKALLEKPPAYFEAIKSKAMSRFPKPTFETFQVSEEAVERWRNASVDWSKVSETRWFDELMGDLRQVLATMGVRNDLYGFVTEMPGKVDKDLSSWLWEKMRKNDALIPLLTGLRGVHNDEVGVEIKVKKLIC